jgi:hypothetical protein
MIERKWDRVDITIRGKEYSISNDRIVSFILEIMFLIAILSMLWMLWQTPMDNNVKAWIGVCLSWAIIGFNRR